ncbi:MAG: hypothetical protein EB102_11210 [Gammaproteobacteria bacterium]|nr:hypothetical protein [Gammaproteobacteria bacterium]
MQMFRHLAQRKKLFHRRVQYLLRCKFHQMRNLAELVQLLQLLLLLEVMRSLRQRQKEKR